MNTENDVNIRRACVRCGTCCQKGGPALHSQDRCLYIEGHLQKGDLFTLRKGERVFDNVREEVIELEEEIVRLRSEGNTTRCLFLHQESYECTIYGNRPAECRVLKCWDPRELVAMYASDRIGRLDLLSRDTALGTLIVEHENRCSHAEIKTLSEAVLRRSQKALDQLTSIVDFDHRLREGLREQAGAQTQELDFLFGRPVQQTLPGYGLKISRRRGIVTVSPVCKG